MNRYIRWHVHMQADMFADEAYLLEELGRFSDRGVPEGKRFVEKHLTILRPESLAGEAVRFAELLVRLGLNRVSILAGGIAAVQERGMASSSSADDTIKHRVKRNEK